MTLFESILLGICIICIAGPTIWMWLTPPKRSDYWRPSPLLLDSLRRQVKIARAMERFDADHSHRERL